VELTDYPPSKIINKENLVSRAAIIKKKKYGKYFNVEYISEPKSICKFIVKYTIDKEKLNSDKRLDGTFLIQTNTKKYDDKELIHVYKNLNEVETAFKVIKNELDIRPMSHWKESRVKGHVYLCVLAYYIYNSIRYKLIKNNISLSVSVPKLLNKLRKISLVEIEVMPNNTIYNLTEIDVKDKEIFDKMNIKMTLPKSKLHDL